MLPDPEALLRSARPRRHRGQTPLVGRNRLDRRERDLLIERHRDLLGDFSGEQQLSDLDPPVLQALHARLTGDPAIAPKVVTFVSDRTQGMDASIGLSPTELVRDLVATATRCAQQGVRCGYLYPCHVDEGLAREIDGTNAGLSHIEAFVLTESGSIINAFPSTTAIEARLEGLFQEADIPLFRSDVSRFVEPTGAFSPQARTRACGSLSLVYLDEYLRPDGASPASHGCLAQGRLADRTFHFSIPPASALAYAESELYLKLLAAVVGADAAMAEVEHEGRVFRVTTFAGLMERGQATFQGLDGSEASSDDFLRYRAAWLEQLENHVLPERRKWDLPLDGCNVNLRLNRLSRLLADGDISALS
jgi:hypothetical protein